MCAKMLKMWKIKYLLILNFYYKMCDETLCLMLKWIYLQNWSKQRGDVSRLYIAHPRVQRRPESALGIYPCASICWYSKASTHFQKCFFAMTFNADFLRRLPEVEIFTTQCVWLLQLSQNYKIVILDKITCWEVERCPLSAKNFVDSRRPKRLSVWEVKWYS